MTEQPEWLALGEEVMGPVLRDAQNRLSAFSGSDFHVVQLPGLALNHLAHSLQTSIDTNRQGRHAVSLSLVRHAVEALTIVELGVVDPGWSYPLLERWDQGRRTHGELRQSLERDIWTRYGPGFWREPWTEFFGQLAKAVQPYAHCSSELLQWNLAMRPGRNNHQLLAVVGMYDATKASRLTLFHVLISWTLGRILQENEPAPNALVSPEDIAQLGSSLSRSNLLTEGQDWSVQFWPHLFFKPGGRAV